MSPDRAAKISRAPFAGGQAGHLADGVREGDSRGVSTRMTTAPQLVFQLDADSSFRNQGSRRTCALVRARCCIPNECFLRIFFRAPAWPLSALNISVLESCVSKRLFGDRVCFSLTTGLLVRYPTDAQVQPPPPLNCTKSRTRRRRSLRCNNTGVVGFVLTCSGRKTDIVTCRA